MFTVKTAAVVGIAALIISFLISLIGGVGFGLVILRALLSGVCFFALTAGGEILLKQFLPELFEPEIEPVINPEKEESSQVDIVIEDDEPLTAAVENLEPLEQEENKQEPDSIYETDTDESDDFIEEVTAVEEVNEKEDQHESVDDSDIDNMEELPSLDSFSDSFESVGSEDGDDSGPQLSAQDMNVDIMGETQNIEEVAQAVRTVMKKDQEG